MGVEVISEIVLKNGLNFPLMDSNNIRGGVHQADTIQDRDNIPKDNLKEGTICFVSDNDTYYQYSKNKWSELRFGNMGDGIPIYSESYLDNLETLPKDYITIPDKGYDFKGIPMSREIKLTGNYVDILFSAIRKLQSEVARLSNSFKYGIYSYTDKNTAISAINADLLNPDEEPLWAIEEDDLSLLDEVTMGIGHNLEPAESVNVSHEGELLLNGIVTWRDEKTFIEVTDPKIFTYLTVTKPNVIFNLKGITGNLSINLSNLNLPLINIYNIMILINRLESDNYIWISITNAENNLILKEGYYNDNLVYENKVGCGQSYTISNILFQDLILSKCTFYSKYLDFTHEIIPSMPSESDYKYSVAHITIRSVKSEPILQEIKNQLPNNELIWCESTKKLWIKSKDSLFAISGVGGGGGFDNDGMTEAEVIAKLKEMGIVREEGQNLQISDISDLTFIHQATGKKFKFQVDAEGSLYSQELSNNTLDKRISTVKITPENDIRGIIGLLRIAENNLINPDYKIEREGDAKIFSDRIKIGAFYAPFDNLKVHGCSHAYIELENTADCDFALEGCYLHYTRPNSNGRLIVYHLPLTGILKAGSTYLIRGKQYANLNETYLSVDSYDQEWYIGNELIDLSVDTSIDYSSASKTCGYGFALTYGNKNLSELTPLYEASSSDKLAAININGTTKNFPWIYNSSFIDAIYYTKLVLNESGTGYWANGVVNIKPNSIYKNSFELDPAKLAFLSLNKVDSSRVRWASGTDILVLTLDKEFIAFPKTEDIYPISSFTPKASYLKKTVATDKSKLDMEKPNMVSSAFGINMYTTRCFNWISAGLHDEYIWIKKDGEYKKFSSYTNITEPNQVDNIYPRRKEFDVNINNTIYARMTGRFPGSGIQYTSHKVILELVENAVLSPTTYTYICGRADKNGNPDPLHTSNELTITLYPENYIPRIYQITDLQGFDWVQYQVWAAASKEVLKKIEADKLKEHIIPIVINTGDMTQNGTRINEWLDYYNAGRDLFSKYEQMNVVGNNDLCGTDINILGTGDDVGKSNSFYFHVFYCYEINPQLFIPIVKDKYIPSLYYFDSKSFRFMMVNSEITEKNCQDWFLLKNAAGKTINIYSGYTIGETSYNKYWGDSSANTFMTIYTMIYKMLNTANTKKVIAVCHEMPFTVITNESLKLGMEKDSRSLSPKKALIGSHLNLISTTDVKGIYWFSRLLEYFKVPLCIGGHKHTYSCTYPLRENFKWQEGVKNSKDNYSEYKMEETLENDSTIWFDPDKHYTKFPLTKCPDLGKPSTGFYPYTSVPNLLGGVIYFMCQATGYKLTSNKELPSANLKFSMLVPETKIVDGKDSASKELKYPMFGIINLSNKIDVKLARVQNIFTDDSKFNLHSYGTREMSLQFLKTNSANNHGTWSETEENLVQI